MATTGTVPILSGPAGLIPSHLLMPTVPMHIILPGPTGHMLAVPTRCPMPLLLVVGIVLFTIMQGLLLVLGCGLAGGVLGGVQRVAAAGGEATVAATAASVQLIQLLLGELIVGQLHTPMANQP